MRLLTALFLSVLSITSFAQGKKYKFEIDQYKHTISYPDHKTTFYAEAYDPAIILNPTRYYTWYSGNQISTTQGGFSGKLLNGLYSDFYLNKNLKEQGTYIKGLKTGRWNTWSEQGHLLSRINYSDGVAEGHFYNYDGLGNLKEKGLYRNGKLQGKLVKYISADSVQKIHYKDGKITQKKKIKFSWFSKIFHKKKK